MMNRRGGIFLGIIVGLLIFLFGTLFIGFIDAEVLVSQNSNNLDCDNPNISDGVKVNCLITEAVSPYFIIAIISAAGGVIVGRFLV